MADVSQFDTGQMLREIILGSQDMASKVGSRVYPCELPDSTSYEPNSADFPAIFYSYVDDYESSSVPVSSISWQFTVVANKQSELQEVCGMLKNLFNRYKSGRIRYVQYVSSSEDIDPDTKKYYSPMTFRVKFF